MKGSSGVMGSCGVMGPSGVKRWTYGHVEIVKMCIELDCRIMAWMCEQMSLSSSSNSYVVYFFPLRHWKSMAMENEH